MANEVLGQAKCPLCGATHQEVRQSEKSRKPYINCDECGAQIFARLPESVRIMRDMARAEKVEAEPVQITREPVAEPQTEPVKPIDTPRPVRTGLDAFMWGAVTK